MLMDYGYVVNALAKVSLPVSERGGLKMYAQQDGSVRILVKNATALCGWSSMTLSTSQLEELFVFHEMVKALKVEL